MVTNTEAIAAATLLLSMAEGVKARQSKGTMIMHSSTVGMKFGVRQGQPHIVTVAKHMPQQRQAWELHPLLTYGRRLLAHDRRLAEGCNAC